MTDDPLRAQIDAMLYRSVCETAEVDRFGAALLAVLDLCDLRRYAYIDGDDMQVIRVDHLRETIARELGEPV